MSPHPGYRNPGRRPREWDLRVAESQGSSRRSSSTRGRQTRKPATSAEPRYKAVSLSSPRCTGVPGPRCFWPPSQAGRRKRLAARVVVTPDCGNRFCPTWGWRMGRRGWSPDLIVQVNKIVHRQRPVCTRSVLNNKKCNKNREYSYLCVTPSPPKKKLPKRDRTFRQTNMHNFNVTIPLARNRYDSKKDILKVTANLPFILVDQRMMRSGHGWGGYYDGPCRPVQRPVPTLVQFEACLAFIPGVAVGPASPVGNFWNPSPPPREEWNFRNW